MPTKNIEIMDEQTENTSAESDEAMEPIESIEAQLTEWREMAHRKAAELENMRRRTDSEKKQLVIYAAEHTLIKMLPVLDDLHAAVAAARHSDDVTALKTGLDMIYDKTVKVFEEMGVKIIEEEPGTPFSVDFHEALMHIPSEIEEGTVVKTVQRGYQWHDKVLRHAKVITSAGKEG